MNIRKLLFLGLIGFYSCMPIQIQTKNDNWIESISDKVGSFLNRRGDDLALLCFGRKLRCWLSMVCFYILNYV